MQAGAADAPPVIQPRGGRVKSRLSVTGAGFLAGLILLTATTAVFAGGGKEAKPAQGPSP